MSIWEEQQKILNENLRKVKGRMEIDPGYVSKDIQEAIEQRENIKATLEDMSLFNQLKEKGYNPTMRVVKLHKFVTVITVTSDLEYVGETAEDAALAAQQWLEYGLNTAHAWHDNAPDWGGIEFNFHTYQVSETPMPEDLAEEYGSETYMWPPLETSKHYSV